MRRVLNFEGLERRELLAAHNFDRPLDVDNDGEVTSRDVFAVAFAVVGIHQSQDNDGLSAADVDAVFADVNNDGRASLVDILQVVRSLGVASPQNTVTWEGNGHDYAVIFDPVSSPTWEQAQLAAERMVSNGRTGHLVTITSTDEAEWIRSTLLRPHSEYPDSHWAAHIGLTDSESHGGRESYDLTDRRSDGWVWVTGEPVEWTDWAREPDNGNDSRRPAEQDYASIYSIDGEWRDSFGSRSATYIVEFSRTFRA